MKEDIVTDEMPELSVFDKAMIRQGSSEKMPLEAWADISEEEVRLYRFPGEQQTTIVGPVALAMNQRGSHRIIDREGVSHYIPSGWIQLSWKARGNTPYFRF